MLTSSSEEATAIYEKFQNIDRHIQFHHSGPSLRQYLMKKNYNTIATYTLANCPKESKHMPKNLHYLLFNLLEMP